MGFLDKVMFWKKHDDFSDLGIDKGFGKENLAFGDDLGMGNQGYPQQQQPYPSQPFPQQPSFSPPSFSQQSFPPQQPYQYQGYGQQDMASKNLEIISSKLDALRTSIESLNQRLANLEAMARGEEDTSRRRKYY